jgi:hypothetical protein
VVFQHIHQDLNQREAVVARKLLNLVSTLCDQFPQKSKELPGVATCLTNGLQGLLEESLQELEEHILVLAYSCQSVSKAFSYFPVAAANEACLQEGRVEVLEVLLSLL